MENIKKQNQQNNNTLNGDQQQEDKEMPSEDMGFQLNMQRVKDVEIPLFRLE